MAIAMAAISTTATMMPIIRPVLDFWGALGVVPDDDPSGYGAGVGVNVGSGAGVGVGVVGIFESCMMLLV